MAIDPAYLVGDVVASARVRLVGALVAANLVGPVVGADGVGTQPVGPYSDAWVFPAAEEDGRPLRAVESTGLTAVTLHVKDEWGANVHNTMHFPVLTVLIFADCSRDPEGNPTARDAELRCKAVAKVIDKTLHDPANVNHDWPLGLRVHSCLRESMGLTIMDIPNGDGAVRGQLRYDVATDQFG
jgi:hypothetical protein